jgi:hypothetical protein
LWTTSTINVIKSRFEVQKIIGKNLMIFLGGVMKDEDPHLKGTAASEDTSESNTSRECV